jgi:integrase
MNKAKRRERGDNAIYWVEARQCYRGAISLESRPDGKRLRRVVSGQTKQAVRDKIKNLQAELDSNVRSSAIYTLGMCLDDWLADCLTGKSPATRENYAHMAAHLKRRLGRIKLRDLTKRDVEAALAPELSARSLRLIHQILERAIRHADDLVVKNVAASVKLADLGVAGKPGRPSKSLDLAEAVAVLGAAAGTRLYAYVVLSLLVGARTEELRPVTWDDVDLAGKPDATSPVPPSISIVRSVRVGGGLKTEKSERRLALPTLAVEALQALKLQQARDRAAAGALWQENDLVFSSNVGTQLDHHNVRRGFIKITQAAGVGGDWTPRELRHSFVSLLSEDGMSIERISHLVGHKTTAVTESVYRHPVSIQADHVEPFARLFSSREAS